MYRNSFEYGINSRITKVRKSKDITQAQLAEKLGYKSSTYSQAERTGNFPAFLVRDIADILGVDVCYFLYGEEYLTPQKDPKTEEIEEPKPKQRLVLSKKEEEVIKLLRLFEKEERAEVHDLIGKIYNLRREKLRAKKK